MARVASFSSVREIPDSQPSSPELPELAELCAQYNSTTRTIPSSPSRTPLRLSTTARPQATSLHTTTTTSTTSLITNENKKPKKERVKKDKEKAAPKKTKSKASANELTPVEDELSDPLESARPRKRRESVPNRVATKKSKPNDAAPGTTSVADVPTVDGAVVVICDQKPKRTRKPRAKKAEKDTQSKLPKGKITKPSTTSEDQDKTKAGDESLRKDDSVISVADEPLGLDKVIPRRTNWTPVKDTSLRRSSLPPDEDDVIRGNESPIPEVDLSDYVGRLADSFAYDSTSSGSGLKRAQSFTREATTKRRKLEFVDALPRSFVQQPPPLVQKKPAKKKARTITEKATEEFMAVSNEDSSIVEYFPAKEVTTKITVQKSARAKVTKSGKSRAAPKKDKSPVSTLLPPEQALKAAENQEFVFVTSSQMARGESPTLIRDTQKALKESLESQGDFIPIDDIDDHSQNSSLLGLRGKKNLWSAAMRNEDGSLLEASVVDLTRKSDVDLTRSLPPDPPNQTFGLKPTPNLQSPVREASPFSIPSTPEKTPDTRKPNPPPAPVIPAPDPITKTPSQKPSTPPKKTKAAKMPNYKDWDTEKLQKAVKRYGFKPPKSKKTLIAILEQCWESKNKSPRRSLTPKANTQNDSVLSVTEQDKSSAKEVVDLSGPEPAAAPIPATKTTKPRGRPRKASSTQLSPTADPPPVILAPSTQPLSHSTTPASPKIRSSATTATKSSKPMDDHTYLHSAITEAVKTFPPSHDPLKPTWYEKILMYDPIILEDLTIWLNTEGLGRIGCDEEVWPGFVREWCESKSICCLWRLNIKGKERKGALGRE